MIPVEQLVRQLVEMVELLAAPASEQKEWLSAEGYPPDELALQFIDAIPGWFGRIEQAGMLSEPAKERLLALKGLLGMLLVPAHHSMWEISGLTDGSQDWATIREFASLALLDLGRSRPSQR